MLGTGASVARSEAGSTGANEQCVSDRGVGTDRLSNKTESSSKEFRVKKKKKYLVRGGTPAKGNACVVHALSVVGGENSRKR